MNRTFYSFALFFSILAFALTLTHSLLYFSLGRPLYTMQSFTWWFLLGTIITLIISLIILKYYHSKRYKLAFIAGAISALSALLFSLVVYGMMKGAQWMNYYIPLYIFTLLTGIVYGVSLVPSPAGERPWLRAAGILLIVLETFLLIVVVAFTQQALNYVEVERIHQWTSLAGMLIPAFFTLNFLRELEAKKQENPDLVVNPTMKIIMLCMGVLAFVASMIVGLTFFSESMGAIAWNKQAPERTQRLAEPFEPRTFVGSNGETLLYRFMKPVDYDSTKAYPLVVCLHHGGTHGNDNIKQVDGAPAAQVLSGYENQRKYPAFLFVPQCPEGSGWGGVATLPAIDGLVFEAIAEFEKEFSVDEKRRYVTGISGGGYGSWHFISTRPEMFAASIPICGGANPQLASKAVSVPVWAFHGEEDSAVPVRFSREMVSAIKDAGGDPKYTEFDGAGHNIWEQVKATPGLWDWMFAQERD
jgi:hypothetical protein